MQPWAARFVPETHVEDLEACAWWSRTRFRILNGCVYLTPWAIKIRGLLHARACTHAHALHAQSPDRFAAHTSVSDPDLERVSLDTTGDQDSSTYCTRELASFMYGEVHATAEPNNPADTQLATQPHATTPGPPVT